MSKSQGGSRKMVCGIRRSYKGYTLLKKDIEIMSKSQGGSSRRRTRDRRNRNQNTPSAQRNPVEAGFGRARRAISRRTGNSV